MTTIDQKHAIVQSLNHLDAVESEKVLDYIKTMLESKTVGRSGGEPKGAELKEVGHAVSKVRLMIWRFTSRTTYIRIRNITCDLKWPLTNAHGLNIATVFYVISIVINH